MPELPEVEIVKQSLKSAIKYKKLSKVIVKNRNLRFKVPINFERSLKNKVILNISRISKYIVIEFKNGYESSSSGSYDTYQAIIKQFKR